MQVRPQLILHLLLGEVDQACSYQGLIQGLVNDQINVVTAAGENGVGDSQGDRQRGLTTPQQRFMSDQLLVHDAAIVQANCDPFPCFQQVAQPLRLSLTTDPQQQGVASII